MWLLWSVGTACLTSDSSDEFAELRERIAVLEAVSGGSTASGVDLSDIENRLSLLEDRSAQDDDKFSQIDASIENIESAYATSSDIDVLNGALTLLDQRVVAVESSLTTVQSDFDVLSGQITTLQVDNDLLSQEVDAAVTDIASIQSHVPEVFQISGSYNAYISSSAWTTLSGSELPMAISSPGILMVTGYFSVNSSYCGGNMIVEVVDSVNSTVGAGSSIVFATNLYTTTGSYLSHGSMEILSTGNYTARIKYNGGSNGVGYCYLTTYQTNAVFVPSP